jgi:hypothetical protein
VSGYHTSVEGVMAKAWTSLSVTFAPLCFIFVPLFWFEFTTDAYE